MKGTLGWPARRILNGLSTAAAGLLLALALSLSPLGQAAPASAGSGIVIIDPGHGGVDCGAVGVSGAEEAGLNLAVAKLLQQELQSLGIGAELTRQDENALASGKNADLAARRALMNRPEALAVVSIHMNKFTDCSVHGPMAFYMEGSAEWERLARLTIESVCRAIGAPKRPANPGDYYVIRESRPPAVLVECGFLSNSADEALLQQPEHQRKLAKGIAAGVAEYLGMGLD